MSVTNVVSTTAPLLAAGDFSSGPLQTTRALSITGTAFSDVAGNVFVDQGGDGLNWDFTTEIAVSAGVGAEINVTLVDQFYQVRYVNGGTPQTVFRLYVNPRDPYGAFLAASLPPSSGGAFGILYFSPAADNYSFVGRYDGLDAYNAISNAAISTRNSGKYAAFVVEDAVVSDETIVQATEHAPDSF